MHSRWYNVNDPNPTTTIFTITTLKQIYITLRYKIVIVWLSEFLRYSDNIFVFLVFQVSVISSCCRWYEYPDRWVVIAMIMHIAIDFLWLLCDHVFISISIQHTALESQRTFDVFYGRPWKIRSLYHESILVLVLETEKCEIWWTSRKNYNICLWNIKWCFAI